MNLPTTPGSQRRARTRTAQALLATAAVALTSAVTTGGAHAGDHPSGIRPGKDQSISVKGGYAEFRHYGDILEVSDGVLDGRGVRVEFGGVDDNGVPNEEFGDYRANGVPVRRNLSLPEHRNVVLRICYTVDREIDQCSGWQHAVT
jgi:hypothetical protein